MKEYFKEDNIKYKSNNEVDEILGKHITTIKINFFEMLIYLLFLPVFVVILSLFEEPFTVLGIAFVFSIFEIYLLIKFFGASKIKIFQYGIKYKKLNTKFDDLEMKINSNVNYSFDSGNIKVKYKPLKVSKNDKHILDSISKLVEK